MNVGTGGPERSSGPAWLRELPFLSTNKTCLTRILKTLPMNPIILSPSCTPKSKLEAASLPDSNTHLLHAWHIFYQNSTHWTTSNDWLTHCCDGHFILAGTSQLPYRTYLKLNTRAGLKWHSSWSCYFRCPGQCQPPCSQSSFLLTYLRGQQQSLRCLDPCIHMEHLDGAPGFRGTQHCCHGHLGSEPAGERWLFLL